MTENTNNGMGFFGWLTLVFIILKLTNFISWSWWFVLLPLWGPISLIIGIGLIFLICVGIFKLLEKLSR